MQPASQAISSDPAASCMTEQAERAEHARLLDRRTPSARETMATLPDIEDSEFDFEPHDTIPAPTWLEDELLPPRNAP
jgi:hypothetical protein